MIKKYYGRDSVVIHPPVDIDRFSSLSGSRPPSPREGFLASGRFTPYKRFDLAVKACTKQNIPLIVVGDGPENEKLRKLADPTIKFVGPANDKEIVQYFQSAKALIFPGLEDFGITPIEAMAAGTPVIAYKAGGALDYITPKTGLFFDKQTVDSLMDALQRFDALKFNQKDLTDQAKQFDKSVFKEKIIKFLEEKCTS
jgi:glycosyltransferase involved in cell wall biosynthesis